MSAVGVRAALVPPFEGQELATIRIRGVEYVQVDRFGQFWRPISLLED